MVLGRFFGGGGRGGGGGSAAVVVVEEAAAGGGRSRRPHDVDDNTAMGVRPVTPVPFVMDDDEDEEEQEMLDIGGGGRGDPPSKPPPLAKKHDDDAVVLKKQNVAAMVVTPPPPDATNKRARRSRPSSPPLKQPSFLGKTTKDGSREEEDYGRVTTRLRESFFGALTNTDLTAKVQTALTQYGSGRDYQPSQTLLATSFCSDEVNRELEHDLAVLYGNPFRMGGLAGFPFGGATSFGAMAHHIPDGGSCLVVYGPHVGIDTDGNVGKVNRRGRHKSSGTCCGSAADAASFVRQVREGTKSLPCHPNNPFDAQQTFVRRALHAYGQRLEDAKGDTSDVELPHALFDCQDELLRSIVKSMCGEVHSPGKIALLGGIQINTPPGMPDYFLPKKFDVLDNEANLLVELRSKLHPPPVDMTLKTFFDGALTNSSLTGRVTKALSDRAGYDPSTTLVATSFCCDEVNRELEHELAGVFGYTFNMGGLAGFPFGGATSFGAMAHHIPDGGSCLVVFGPHVGIDTDGNVGKVNRRGRHRSSGTCCGSAVEALDFTKKIVSKDGNAKMPPHPKNAFDANQHFVRKSLLPRANRVLHAKEPMVELPHALLDSQDTMMHRIVEKMSGEVPGEGKVALLGGIQINTPAGFPDYFLPKSFIIIDRDGDVEDDLISSLHVAF